MSRRVLILVVVVCWFALIVWSGYQHRYARRSTALSSTTAAASVESTASQDTDAVTSPLLDKPAPNFELRDLTGRQVSLADYRGQAVLINFWATWCAPCQVEMPWFIDLQQKYAAQGFTVLGIDKDYPEDLPKVPGFAKKMNLNYPVLYGNRRTYADYGCCDYLPMSYYVDRAGVIRIATVGLGERETVESYIRGLLESSPPQPDTQITASTAATPPAAAK
ncbi:MAG TPA: TlpA disulfide reductase family protein [Acidobacteriaceae bacterium]|nr:TlpA disulfide reductase family protein [Acidobacteriaceae bacterium]